MQVPVFTFTTIAVTVFASVIGFRHERAYRKGIFNVGAILRGNEFYRLVTSLLFHVNWAHLAFNMFSFYSFSAHVEIAFGPAVTAGIYFASGLAGDVLSLAVNRKNADYSATGASGAVAGIIFASIFLLPGGSIYVFPIPMAIPAWAFAVIFMAVSLYGIGRGGSTIGHEAHLGGALAGIAFAVIYNPSIAERDPLLLAAITIPAAVLLVYFVRGGAAGRDHSGR